MHRVDSGASGSRCPGLARVTSVAGSSSPTGCLDQSNHAVIYGVTTIWSALDFQTALIQADRHRLLVPGRPYLMKEEFNVYPCSP